MQDRYLFRGKCKTNGEWVKGAYYENPYADISYIIRWNGLGIGLNEIIEVDPSTVCQCTGRNDKNGKLIWENDIMQAHLDDDFPDDVTVVKILWHENGWRTNQPGCVDYEELDEFTLKCFEVVGNVFDNLELLEVQK